MPKLAYCPRCDGETLHHFARRGEWIGDCGGECLLCDGDRRIPVELASAYQLLAADGPLSVDEVLELRRTMGNEHPVCCVAKWAV
jgi:hypothetical protein